ncbi:MAG: hypothetical protein ACTHKU_05930 [Verrucomicrobiota bacterium]
MMRQELSAGSVVARATPQTTSSNFKGCNPMRQTMTACGSLAYKSLLPHLADATSGHSDTPENWNMDAG